MKLIYKTLLLGLFIVLTSCSSDDDNAPTVEEQRTNFVTERVLTQLDSLGFNFVLGNDNLDFTGAFNFEPLELVASNISGDPGSGTRFSPETISFADIQFSDRTFTTSISSSSTNGSDASETFFTAQGDNLNAFIRILIDFQNQPAELIVCVAGRVDEEGIVNAQYALFMLDDFDDPNNILIENGEGRLFKDSDNLAAREPIVPGSTINNGNNSTVLLDAIGSN